MGRSCPLLSSFWDGVILKGFGMRSFISVSDVVDFVFEGVEVEGLGKRRTKLRRTTPPIL